MRLTAVNRALILPFLVEMLAYGQAHQPAPQPREQTAEQTAAAGRGHALFKSSCGFCHGNDATGSRGPDLLRSSVTLHDENGSLLGPVIRNGRPDKGMPSFSNLKAEQVEDIVAFLHVQANAASHSAKVPGDYPLAKLLTGDASAGKTYFNGTGGCAGCHSVTGDLAGIAKKFSPVNLQQEFVYPSSKTAKKKTAVVTLKDGSKFEGTVEQDDEFTIAIRSQDGWYRSWPKTEAAVEIRDPLAAHRDLMAKYTDQDMHNVFAYLETLK